MIKAVDSPKRISVFPWPVIVTIVPPQWVNEAIEADRANAESSKYHKQKGYTEARYVAKKAFAYYFGLREQWENGTKVTDTQTTDFSLQTQDGSIIEYKVHSAPEHSYKSYINEQIFPSTYPIKREGSIIHVFTLYQLPRVYIIGCKANSEFPSRNSSMQFHYRNLYSIACESNLRRLDIRGFYI